MAKLNNVVVTGAARFLADVYFSGNVTLNGKVSATTVEATNKLKIPVVSSDPSSPEVGQMWINTSA